MNRQDSRSPSPKKNRAEEWSEWSSFPELGSHGFCDIRGFVSWVLMIYRSGFAPIPKNPQESPTHLGVSRKFGLAEPTNKQQNTNS